MNGPQTCVRLDEKGNVKYGFQDRRRLLAIRTSFEFKNATWLLILWEGYDCLESVPLRLLPKHYLPEVKQFFSTVDLRRKEPDANKRLKM